MTPRTTWKWLRAIMEHEAPYRGQLYLMLGMRGICVPPLYGLTEEELPARSSAPDVACVSFYPHLPPVQT